MAHADDGRRGDRDPPVPPDDRWSRAEEPSPDPFLGWMTATQFRYVGGPPDRIPVLIELADSTARAFADSTLSMSDWIVVPALFLAPSSGLSETSFVCALVTEQFFARVTSDDLLKKQVKRFEVSHPGPMNGFGSRRGGEVPDPQLAATQVLTAVIDDGFAFAQQRLRNPSGSSRLSSVWQQDGTPPSAAMSCGREFSNADIYAALKRNTFAGLCDEDAVYRDLGYETYVNQGHKPLGRRRSHGSHVLDLACGDDPAMASPNRPVVAVQLPNFVTRDPALHLGYYALLAVRHILAEADRIALAAACGPLPVVVNLSYGLLAGPHDGRSCFEAALDQLISHRNQALSTPHGVPFSVVLPSGNSHLSRCHAHWQLTQGADRRIDWRVQPDGQTASHLQIWLPAPAGGNTPEVEVQLIDPRGNTSPVVGRGTTYERTIDGHVVCRIVYFTGEPGSRDRVVISIAPTATVLPLEPVLPAGTWHVDVVNCAADAEMDAWIERNETRFGWPLLGRQSRFDDPLYERFDEGGRYSRADCLGTEIDVDNTSSIIRRADSMNSLATGAEPVVVAGFRKQDMRTAPYSAGGLTPRTPFAYSLRDGPDLAAVSDDSRVRHGVLAAGTRSGSVVAMDGTSVAAPQVARWIADRMARGLATDRGTIDGVVASKDPPTTHPHAPPERIGSGRIDPRVPRKVTR
jgi:hypothetical protein